MIPPDRQRLNDERRNSLVGWRNTFNMRQVTMMSIGTSPTLSKSGRSNLCMHHKVYSTTSPAKSLELLRKNLQTAINKDIEEVIRKYLDKFFKPAVMNIKHNLGRDSVNDDDVREVCQRMLDHAKQMYRKAPPGESPRRDCSDSEGRVVVAEARPEAIKPPPTPSPATNKHKERDIENNASTSKKVKLAPAAVPTHLDVPRLPWKRDGPRWDPSRVHDKTLFIMGSRANKVLGYGQSRGRLYVRHPELVRYAADQADRDWLSSKSLMQPNFGRAYLMILSDIKDLVESEEYKHNPNVQLHELQGFRLPSFLLKKFKKFLDNVRTDKKNTTDLIDVYDFDSQTESTTPATAQSAFDALLLEHTKKSYRSSSSSSTDTPESSKALDHPILSRTLTQGGSFDGGCRSSNGRKYTMLKEVLETSMGFPSTSGTNAAK